MTLQSLFSSDKSPLIIAVALTIFGWYVNSISNYFSEQTIIYVSADKTSDTDKYTIKNVSLSKGIENASLQIQCVAASDCLLNYDLEQIAPFAIVGNQTCYKDKNTYQNQISLPPGASVRIGVQKRTNTKTDLFFAGHYRSTCQELEPAQIRIEHSPSPIAFLLENFILYYFASIIFLIIVFVMTIWRLTSTGTGGASTGEEEDVAQNLNVRLTFNPDPASDTS